MSRRRSFKRFSFKRNKIRRFSKRTKRAGGISLGMIVSLVSLYYVIKNRK